MPAAAEELPRPAVATWIPIAPASSHRPIKRATSASRECNGEGRGRFDPDVNQISAGNRLPRELTSRLQGNPAGMYISAVRAGVSES